MNDIVLVKGNKTGLTILLDDSAGFALIKQTLFDKLAKSKSFFGNSNVTIEFKGRQLNDLERNDLINIVKEATDLEIACVIDEGLTYPVFENSNLSDRQLDNITAGPIFHKGTLRSGQELVVASSIIIIGNVHVGAKIVSDGNVIIIGDLKGSAYAGDKGNANSFIVALKMNPLQLKIGNVYGRSTASKLKELDKPKIAFVEEGRICIEKINRNIYKDIDFLNYK